MMMLVMLLLKMAQDKRRRVWSVAGHVGVVCAVVVAVVVADAVAATAREKSVAHTSQWVAWGGQIRRVRQ